MEGVGGGGEGRGLIGRNLEKSAINNYTPLQFKKAWSEFGLSNFKQTKSKNGLCKQ